MADIWRLFVYPIDNFYAYKILPSVLNMSKESKRERITIRLTKRYMQLLNELIERGVYNSRNEAVRDALRLLFEHHGLRVSSRGEE